MVLAAGAMRRSCGVVARRDRLRGDVAARSTTESVSMSISRELYTNLICIGSPTETRRADAHGRQRRVVIEELQLEVFCFCSCSNVLYHLGLTVVLRALFMLPDGLYVSSMSNTRLMVATK